MSQTSYNLDMVIGQAGGKADSGFDNVLTYLAAENINFGFGLVQDLNNENAARVPSTNVAVLSFDADFVTDNNIDLDVNGVAITTVPFNTDQATTLADLAAELDSLDDISATVTDAREITVVSNIGAVLLENIAVTGGASQANGSVAYDSNEVFVGVAILEQAHEQDLDGNVFYKATDAVSTMTRGRIYVFVEDAVTVASPVYLRFADNGAGKVRGQFRSDDDSGNAFLVEGARFTKGAEAGGLAVLEVNLPR
jgi:hypothetical protein